MKYKKTPARLSVVRAYCDCGEELRKTGFVFPGDPPMYEHECPSCWNRYNLPKSYPITEIETFDSSD
jgi:hypothetical protein